VAICGQTLLKLKNQIDIRVSTQEEIVPEKPPRTTVHLGFELAYWMALNSSSKGNTLPIHLQNCAYCGAAPKPNSSVWIQSSISGQWPGDPYLKTLAVSLTLPLCEQHSPKPKPEAKEEKGNWWYLIGFLAFIGLIIYLSSLLQRTPFFAGKAMMWSVMAVTMVLGGAAIGIILLVEWIQKRIKKEPAALPPAVLVDGNLSFHFLRPETAAQLQAKFDAAAASYERSKNRTWEEEMEEGSGQARPRDYSG
jgi:hypothetical protein